MNADVDMEGLVADMDAGDMNVEERSFNHAFWSDHSIMQIMVCVVWYQDGFYSFVSFCTAKLC